MASFLSKDSDMNILKNLALAATVLATANAFADTPPTKSARATEPTIILVHGAFADSASWNGVIPRLTAHGYKVVAAANPLQSVAGDAKVVDSLVEQAEGPVVLVGHSYGGSVISNVAANPKVKALVYVAAFAPDQGESALDLTGKFPGSTLGPALAPPVKRADGSEDLYIQQDKFGKQFAADVPVQQTALMAVAQRPINKAALTEHSGAGLWHSVPSWFVFGDADKNIPAQGLAFMADRAGAREIKIVKGASHVVMVSHPKAVADLIVDAVEQRPTQSNPPAAK